MKTTKHLQIIICMMIIVCASFSTVFSKTWTDGDTTIVITPRPNGDPTGPRSTVNNPFRGYYSQGHVIISSEDGEYGIVDVLIMSSDFDIYETEFDTNDGLIYCPVGDQTGEYLIIITTESELVFTGDYQVL